MKKVFVFAVLAMAMCVGFTACSDDWQEEEIRWASQQIGGVWEAPNTEGTLMPDGSRAEYYELSIKVYEERGVLTNYAVAIVAGDKKYVTEYGTIGHPNGEPDNVIDYVNRKKGEGYRFIFVWGNSAHTQFEFGDRTWTKTDRVPWVYNY